MDPPATRPPHLGRLLEADLEQELKLAPLDAGLLDRLAEVETLGPFVVAGRRLERQRNAFFDTREGALGTARLTLRRRQIEGQRLATWTLKGQGRTVNGIAARPEVEVYLDPDTPPLVALALLRQAARERGSDGLAELAGRALEGASPLLATPRLEMHTQRRILDLEAADQGWRVELALDRVGIDGWPEYADVEIEAELKAGDTRALEAARDALAALGPVRPSDGTKQGRARRYLRQVGRSDAAGAADGRAWS